MRNSVSRSMSATSLNSAYASMSEVMSEPIRALVRIQAVGITHTVPLTVKSVVSGVHDSPPCEAASPLLLVRLQLSPTITVPVPLALVQPPGVITFVPVITGSARDVGPYEPNVTGLPELPDTAGVSVSRHVSPRLKSTVSPAAKDVPL